MYAQRPSKKYIFWRSLPNSEERIKVRWWDRGWKRPQKWRMWGLDHVLWINTVPEASHELSQPPFKWVVLPPSYRWRKGSSERLSSWPKITQQRDGEWKPKSRLTQSNACAFAGVSHCLWKFSLFLKKKIFFWKEGQQFVVNRESRDLVPAWGPETEHFMSLGCGVLGCIMRE